MGTCNFAGIVHTCTAYCLILADGITPTIWNMYYETGNICSAVINRVACPFIMWGISKKVMDGLILMIMCQLPVFVMMALVNTLCYATAFRPSHVIYVSIFINCFCTEWFIWDQFSQCKKMATECIFSIRNKN